MAGACPTLASEDIAASAEFRHLSSIAGIAVDLRYAGANNFVGRDLYSPFDCAWLHVEAAAALETAVAWLAGQAPGHTLLVLDALRPQRVQQQLWDALDGTGLQMYLADPARGSIHSYGMALDVTILDPQGRELDMGTGFDDMTDLSHPALEAGFLAAGRLSERQLGHRRLLRGAMVGAGYAGIKTEWWHFDCGDRERVRATFRRVL
ncbi:M15 family metallopeptidase [Massilia jejuensis]|uniref:D-alanyl-D-alanine dipeptidase n=1 Tax=Massilia jejuensis TaxID=648894 RepID=A0ABW0PFM0_9BURK